MSRLLLKTTTDGVKHLYFDDPDNERFIKLAQADNAELIYFDRYAILANTGVKSKILYGYEGNEVFQADLPLNAKIEIIDGICLYERWGSWYTTKYSDGKFREQRLGTRYDRCFSTSEIIKYNANHYKYSLLFLNKSCGVIMVHQFVKNKLDYLGAYRSVEHFGSTIIVSDAKGYFDIFRPNSAIAENGENIKVCGVGGNVFVWIDEKNKWICHENCTIFGQNAIYRISLNNQGNKKIELWRIDGEKLLLEKEGYNWKWKDNSDKIVLTIDDNGYIMDLETRIVDFDNPRVSLKKKIKNFFIK